MATDDETVTGLLSTSEYTIVSEEYVPPLLVLITFIVGWETVVTVSSISELILPKPTSILAALLTNSQIIITQLTVTLQAWILGFGLTVGSGYLLALSMAQSQLIERTVYPYVIVARSVPKIALLPLFIIWFGFGFPSIVAISFLISFFAMVVNTLAGFKSTDPALVEMLKSYTAGRKELFRNVYLYSSLPSVFAGIKICVILSFTGVIVGEFLIGSSGIGHLILSYNNNLETAKMFAGIGAISLTQLALFAAVTLVERRIVSWEYGSGGGF
jgi:NitT/TauT family transport system permease protein